MSRRLDPWDFDNVAPDEELPDYSADSAPAYDDGLYNEPLIIYHLKQYDRRIQMLMAYGPPSTSPSYRITTNGFRLFSKKKPEMEVLYTSPEMRQRNIAVLGFDNNGALPWCPRAHFDYTEPDGSLTTYEMEAKNFADWTLVLGDRRYEWALSIQPSSLVLREGCSSMAIARFTYSPQGTQAMRGAEVGELTLFRDALTMEPYGSDKVVCSFMVAITHMKKMGRNYHNPEQMMRIGSMSRVLMPAH
ncbi:hypothetical protein GQ44DRAFT_702259 [Phaeosphaeriaceae sp. PMI808]|nr:hypothetical protein GQ44DRAFT_702259 [Phaeosphaeriaceae sp. PMI808]